jgi:hypothetical protein
MGPKAASNRSMFSVRACSRRWRFGVTTIRVFHLGLAPGIMRMKSITNSLLLCAIMAKYVFALGHGSGSLDVDGARSGFNIIIAWK